IDTLSEALDAQYRAPKSASARTSLAIAIRVGALHRAGPCPSRPSSGPSCKTTRRSSGRRSDRAHDNLVIDGAHALHVASDLGRALTFARGIHSPSEPDIAVQRCHTYVFQMDHWVFYELGANAVADGGVVCIFRNALPALEHLTGPDRHGQ